MNKKVPSSMNPEAFEEERERMHRQLFSAVSHDLKTPLASMIGALEIHARMKEKLSAEKQAVLIATALQEAYRLDNFISNILDMAKLESGMVKPRHTRFDVGRMLKECLVGLDNRLHGSQVTLQATGGEFDVHSDAALLCRAISLVLDNAVKYGGHPPVIHISYMAEAGSDQCVIRIRDNGLGVTLAQIETIFTKYTRFTKSDHQSAGTGLGLAICRELMRVLGGTVEVTNTPQGDGAIFTLRLPIGK